MFLSIVSIVVFVRVPEGRSVLQTASYERIVGQQLPAPHHETANVPMIKPKVLLAASQRVVMCSRKTSSACTITPTWRIDCTAQVQYYQNKYRILITCWGGRSRMSDNFITKLLLVGGFTPYRHCDNIALQSR